MTNRVTCWCVQENYDKTFVEWVYSSRRMSASEVASGLWAPGAGTIRVQYTDLASFKMAAKLLGIMDDVKVCHSPVVTVRCRLKLIECVVNPLMPTVAIWVNVRVPGCQKLQMTA